MFADPVALVIETCARSSAVLLAAWAATTTMRRASASSRHFVWTCAVVGSLLVSVLTLVGPRWMITVPDRFASVAPFDTAAIAPSPVSTDAGSRLEVRNEPGQRPDDDAAGTVARALPAGNAVAAKPSAQTTSFGIGYLILSAWIAGVGVVLAWILCGAVGAWWLKRGARPIEDSWVDEVHALAEAFDIPGPVIAESNAAAMPMVCGVWRPIIVIPRSASEWSDERRRVVMLHELAHVKRRDCLTQAVARVACALYWFSPLVWIAARQLRIERERACDDFVLAAGTRRADYAAHLLDIAQSTAHRATSPLAALAMARPTQLEGRLLAILDPAMRRASTRLTRLASVASVVVITIPTGTVQLQRPLRPLPVADEIDATTLAVPMETAPSRRSATTSSTLVSTAMPAPRPVPTPTPGKPAAGQAPVSSAVSDAIGPEIDQAVTEALTPELMNRAIAAAMARQSASVAADPKTVEALIGALADPDPDVREMVVVTLARMRDPRAVGALLPLLKDPNAEVREHVVAALARTGDPRVPAAVAAMIDDSSADVRQQVVHLLGQTRNRESVPALTKALKDASPDVREQAAFALGQLRDPSSVDPLLTMLNDPSPDVREQTVFALGHLRSARALDPLIGALKDASPDVREQAAFALGQLRDPKAVPALTTALRDANADVREQAAFAIGQIAGHE